MMTLDKDTLLKVGIAASVALVVYLLFRSRGCSEQYAGYVPALAPDEYAENMYESAGDHADFAHAEYVPDDYAVEEDDEDPEADDEEDDAEDPEADDEEDDDAEYTGGRGGRRRKMRILDGQLLMESTLDDDEANAIFEPEL